MTTITIRDYVKAVMTAMQNILEDYDIEEKDIVKMNDIISHGIIARRRGENAGPTVYLDDAFERGEDISITANTLADIVLEADRNKPVKTDSDIDLSFDAIRDKLTVRLVDIEKNRAYCEEHPHREIGAGLAVVVEINVGSEYSIVVTNDLAKDYDLEKLFDTALANMMSMYPPKMMSLESAIFGEGRNILEGDDADIGGLYTLMIDGAHPYGASALAYEGIAERIRDLFGSGYYILPSSLHEVVLLADVTADADSLKAMVGEANRSVVEPYDVLSDSVFYFGDDGLRRVA